MAVEGSVDVPLQIWGRFTRRSGTYERDMGEYLTSCPACGREFEADEEMRVATLEYGCPICAATLTPAAFTPH